MGELFVVATPIGNMKDVTLRALEVLKSVDCILCEDTRVTKKLLTRYDIQTKTLSYHARSSGSKIEKIISLLKAGKRMALVSDAGTPAVSDPGSFLIQRIREHIPAIRITPIPGASALTAALSVAGVSASDFLFLGFLPHKKGRETIFEEIAGSKRTVIFYESPHRIMKTLTSLSAILDTARFVALLRELTKIHESVISGSVHDIQEYFKAHPSEVRGEFVLVVSGK